MKLIKIGFLVFCAICVVACAGQRMSTKKLPNGVKLIKGVQIPNTTQISYYLPKSQQESRFYIERGNYWVEPGKGLVEGSNAAFATYFPQAKQIDLKNSSDYGLFFDLQPSWDFEGGKIIAKMGYRILDGKSDTPLLTGEKKYSIAFDYAAGASFYNAYMRATQLVLVEVLNKLQPNAEKFPAVSKTANINLSELADMEKPVSLGTGFYFNEQGQMLTANHVLEDCLVVRAKANGTDIEVKAGPKSALLDLAVLDTHLTTKNFLPLRKDEKLILGEMVSSVGYPLQGLLSESANLTRGNVSSMAGMKGSQGQFQFSAPIQPGNSGGPIISDSGQLLGVTVSTLNSKLLIEKGILTQNVNFGLDAKYIAKFLHKYNLAFKETSENSAHNIEASNIAALAATVRVACYQ